MAFLILLCQFSDTGYRFFPLRPYSATRSCLFLGARRIGAACMVFESPTFCINAPLAYDNDEFGLKGLKKSLM